MRELGKERAEQRERPAGGAGELHRPRMGHDLKLAKDPVDELYLRGDTLFRLLQAAPGFWYRSRGRKHEVPGSAAGQRGHSSPAGAARRFGHLSFGSTIDILTNRGRPARTIELDKPIRSGGVSDGTKTIYIGLDHYEARGTVASVDITPSPTR
jgi:hypothetical protein